MAEVDGGLRVSASAEHTVVLGVERVDVAGAGEGLRRGAGVGQCLDGGGAVVGRNARGAAFNLVDGDGERRAEQRGVVLHLVGQVQLDAAADGERCAEHAACVFQHEVHHFRRDFLCGANQVAFILAVFIIDNDDELAVAEVLNGLFYRINLECFHNHVFLLRGYTLLYIGS